MLAVAALDLLLLLENQNSGGMDMCAALAGVEGTLTILPVRTGIKLW
jgi:hypothetical protein